MINLKKQKPILNNKILLFDIDEICLKNDRIFKSENINAICVDDYIFYFYDNPNDMDSDFEIVNEYFIKKRN